MPSDNNRDTRTGLIYGFTAYFVWGFFPVYFKTLQSIPPLEMVAHRIIWSLLFLILIVTATRKWPEIARVFRDRKLIFSLTSSAALITANWLLFIYAVKKGQILQSSLGYFMTPLLNVLLGVFLLGERLRRLQMISLLCAAAGVAILALRVGAIPWISLALAVTFGLYGLLRKTVAVDSLTGLLVETVPTGPVAIAYITWLTCNNSAGFPSTNPTVNLLLPLVGMITATPLIMFASAARRLRLTTIGFLQYMTPSIQFLLAVLIYNETFTHSHMITFMLIWCGLALYTCDALHFFHSKRS